MGEININRVKKNNYKTVVMEKILLHLDKCNSSPINVISYVKIKIFNQILYQKEEVSE